MCISVISSLIRDALSPNLSGELANQFISQSFESLEDVVNFVHQLLCAGPCSGQRASSVKTLFLPFLNLQSGGGGDRHSLDKRLEAGAQVCVI